MQSNDISYTKKVSRHPRHIDADARSFTEKLYNIYVYIYDENQYLLGSLVNTTNRALATSTLVLCANIPRVLSLFLESRLLVSDRKFIEFSRFSMVHCCFTRMVHRISAFLLY